MLTERQYAAYQFVREYYGRNGYAPELSEIAEGIGIHLKGVAHRHLRAIAEEGLSEMIPGRHRGFRMAGDHGESDARGTTLPLVDRIAVGRPIEAIPNQHTVSFSDLFRGANCYALKVQGDSMIEAGILDGDMVIIEQHDCADGGEIVVTRIDNEEGILKRLRNNGDGTITLLPANHTMEPMNFPADKICIQGVVIGQLRSYRSTIDNRTSWQKGP